MPSFAFSDNDLNSNFSLIKTEKIDELIYPSDKQNPKCSAYELKHVSGSKLLYLENDDPELGFAIGFKTLPSNSTGVFHILEHSVLCGSKKFPVKEPFTNLLKSSMQTFLNAMTYPDKTVYPVASTNIKDFYNLIDIYMDAVMYPNIYVNKNIFYQEGGHKTRDGYNGVVFNEMKGVYSEPQEHLFESLTSSLFPNSAYSFSSGGKPGIIEKLSYEEFLKTHASTYSYQNSYIIIYGNLDINKMLNFLDENYLSKNDDLKKWRKGYDQYRATLGNWDCNFEENSKCKKIKLFTNKENSCCGCAYVVKRDHLSMLATKILIEALASSNESPLKSALLKENIAGDINFEFIGELKYPIVLVEAKNIKENSGDKLHDLICKNLNTILSKKIPQNLIKAAISNIEFKYRDKDPDCTVGLDFILDIFTEWLYDDKASMGAIKYIDDLSHLKEKVNTDFFDNLAKEIFIDNKWHASAEVIPTTEKNATLNASNYSEEDLNEIDSICASLEKWQSCPDAQKDVDKLPVMKKTDIGKGPNFPKWNEASGKCKYIKYNINTNGITYINRYYSLNNLSFEDIPYVSILSELLGKLDTSKHSSSELDLIWQEKLGNMVCQCAFFDNVKNYNELNLRLAFYGSALDTNVSYLATFIDEIIFNTKFDDKNKIKTILEQRKLELEQTFISAGHIASAYRALSSVLPSYKAKQLANGVDYYLFIKDILKDFDNCSSKLCNKLKEISKKIFTYSPFISYAGSNTLKIFMEKLEADKYLESPSFYKNYNLQLNNEINEAFIIPNNVNYCSIANDARTANIEFDGSSIVASKIIWLDYLWNEVRVKNGAYGSGMSVNSAGNMYYYSFRDPKVKETFQNYIKSCKWLQNLELDDANLDNYIISSVAKIDSPTPTRMAIVNQDNYYFSNMKVDTKSIIRNQIIKTNKTDIKNAAINFEKLCANAKKCVFGGEELKKLDSSEFKIIDLFAD